MSDEILTTEQILSITGWSRGTLTNRQIQNGFPKPVFKEGTSNHYSKAAVNAWLKQRDDDRMAAIEAAKEAAK